ncbi:MAG: type IV pilin protein [Proteobacteria bacterium]|nr:type IV pilin protein [Pseudomonadota bacterium]
MLRLAINQERFYLNNNTFTAVLSDVGFAGSMTENGYYEIAVTAANASNFTATATYRHGGNEAGKCLTFTIDGRGVKTSSPDTDCWERTR